MQRGSPAPPSCPFELLEEWTPVPGRGPLARDPPSWSMLAGTSPAVNMCAPPRTGAPNRNRRQLRRCHGRALPPPHVSTLYHDTHYSTRSKQAPKKFSSSFISETVKRSRFLPCRDQKHRNHRVRVLWIAFVCPRWGYQVYLDGWYGGVGWLVSRGVVGWVGGGWLVRGAVVFIGRGHYSGARGS